ncbi:MAG TPA: hypothetical protein VH277_20305 [Gemmatimonadaceae bacterium]|nr:hypothetical protein [Gemmatimonadaceae bacterium]
MLQIQQLQQELQVQQELQPPRLIQVPAFRQALPSRQVQWPVPWLPARRRRGSDPSGSSGPGGTSPWTALVFLSSVISLKMGVVRYVPDCCCID